MSKWLTVGALAALVTGCNYGAAAFTCGPDKMCGAGGTCEPTGFCSFGDTTCPPPSRRYGDLSGPDSGKCVDEEPSTCFGTAPLKICLASAPTAPLMISDPTTIDDTSTSSRCAPIVSGGNYCVLAATKIMIGGTLRASGARPLVLIASDSITTTAAIDVGSHRGGTPETGAGADPAVCDAGTKPTNSGGGAGGSFMGTGGTGGVGAAVGTSTGGAFGAVATSITELRGGCPGQDGDGSTKGVMGHGGGAVLLIAGTSITVGGGINAVGEGGAAGTTNTSGGGGGGAGGMIGFDAPTITITSLLLANGGGGGEGSGQTTAGKAGSDPSTIAAAPGGSGNSMIGGDGGDGSAGAAAGTGSGGRIGDVNGANRGGGGGGGGGAGLIKAPAGANVGTNVSPAATP